MRITATDILEDPVPFEGKKIRFAATKGEAKALTLTDNEVVLIAGNGLYRYDEDSALAANEVDVLLPASGVGRLINDALTYAITGTISIAPIEYAGDGPHSLAGEDRNFVVHTTAGVALVAINGFEPASGRMALFRNDAGVSARVTLSSGSYLGDGSGTQATLPDGTYMVTVGLSATEVVVVLASNTVTFA